MVMHTARSATEPVVKRYANNPILTRSDVPYAVETVHNAGVVKHEGCTLMLFRSHLRNGRSIIGKATSEDGYSFAVSPEPFLVPATGGIFAEYEEYGVEDLRICHMEGEDYLLTYSAYSRHGVRIVLARTADFSFVERVAMISPARYAKRGPLSVQDRGSIRPPGPPPLGDIPLVDLHLLFS